MNAIVWILVLLSITEFTQSKMDKDKLCQCKGLAKLRPIEFGRTAEGRVVNGDLLLDQEMQFVAILYERVMGGLIKHHDIWLPDLNNQLIRMFCTGTILNPSWVLSAAHCLDEIRDVGKGSYEKFRVSAGLDHHIRHIMNRTENTRKIWEIYSHPNFTDSSNFGGENPDIGLIQLNYAFDFNARTNIYPVCLINEDERRFGNLYSAGYGLTSPYYTKDKNARVIDVKKPEDTRFSEQLLMLPLNQTDDPKCNENCIATYNNKRSLCEGDSGGPVLTLFRNRFYLVGVTSFGKSHRDRKKNVWIHCLPRSLSFSIRINPYLGWIKEHISEDDLCIQRRW